jgi:glycosyltransferase involved in cell wall biosynthesis
MPFVSVIMTVRDSEKYVSQAIESVLVQTFENFEFIIVDDDSRDTTNKIIKNYQLKDNRIILHKNSKKKGPAESRNIAINKARGKWVSVIDSDDVFFPRKIEKQVNLISKDTIFIGSSFLYIDNKGSHIAFYKYKNNSKILKRNILKNKNFPPHSSYFVKRKYLKKISGYNQRFLMAQDYDLLLRLQIFEDKEFAVCEDVLTKVRIHNQNRSLKKINYFSQLDFAILASICFKIYSKNKKNPAEYLDNNNWLKFIYFVKSYLATLNYYKFLVTKLRYKKRKKITEYIKYLFSVNFFRSYFIGHVLPKKTQNNLFQIYKKKYLK